MTNDDLVRRMTAAMREADRAFGDVGGSTRHHVRDCLLPALERHGLGLVDRTECAQAYRALDDITLSSSRLLVHRGWLSVQMFVGWMVRELAALDARKGADRG